MKRADEEHARASFDRYLRSAYPGESPDWRDVPARDEPPDYFLTVGSRRFAVEVTAIVEMVNVLPTAQPRLAIDSTGVKLLEEAEGRARREGVLRGSYALELCPIDDFSKRRRAILDAVLTYLRETSDRPTAPEAVVHRERGRDWIIWKFSPANAYIGMLGASEAKWGGDIAQELQAHLSRMLERKARLLQRVEDRVILLALDRYGYAAPQLWKAVAASLELPENVSMLVRIAGDGGVEVLRGCSGA